MDTPPRGYDVMLVLAIPKKYKCPFCHLLMRSAVQTYRGEMSCESCYIYAVKSSNGACPIDQEEIGSQNGEMFFPDKAARRLILQLECYCPYKRNKCLWQGVVNDVEQHSSICDFMEIICTQCEDLILRKDEQQHLVKECKFRKSQCGYCRAEHDVHSLQEHEKRCHMKPLQCPYNCGHSIVMEKLFQHVENCPKIKTGKMCPYSIAGCRFQPQDPGDLQNHMIQDSQKHAAFSITLMTTLNQSNERMRQDLQSEQNLRVEMKKKLEEQTKEHTTLSMEIKKMKDQLSTLQLEGIKICQTCEVSEAKMKDAMAEIDTKLQQQDLQGLQGLQRTMEEVKGKYEDFEERIRKGMLGGGGGAGGPVGVGSDEMKQMNEKIDVLERGSAMLSANLSDQELKLQLLENTSHSGKQLWKVDNVMYRMNQAVTGKVTALHSAPCFQKIGGYKFCTRLYLNGDGMGRGTHISLFFVLMKSEHDALLQWPFSERVTFRLINPYNQEDSLKESFIPDKNSGSFKRPQKDMNIAAGCPNFLRKDKLPQYIIDDVIYIECFIGTEDPAH